MLNDLGFHAIERIRGVQIVVIVVPHFIHPAPPCISRGGSPVNARRASAVYVRRTRPETGRRCGRITLLDRALYTETLLQLILFITNFTCKDENGSWTCLYS